MEGSLTLQYKLYIYTSASGNDSLSLNETIDSVLTITVEEKLEATLVSITITSKQILAITLFKTPLIS